MTTIYTVTDFCLDADCQCNHRDGIILYTGDDLAEAKEWRDKSPLYGNAAIEEND